MNLKTGIVACLVALDEVLRGWEGERRRRFFVSRTVLET